MSFKFQSAPFQEKQILPQKPILRLFIIGFLFITAFGIRLYHIDKPPLDFAEVRQYHSVRVARAYYFETLKSIPEWRREVARLNMQRIVLLEPRIVERIASFAYRIAGGEHIWIPRVLSSIFWLIGGIFLYLIAKKIVSTDTALFSTAFYLFIPFGISAGRSFQHDPMMLMMFLFSLFLILRYYEKPTIYGLLLTAIISALAMLIKPVCMFIIFGVFISLAIYKQGIRKSVISQNFLIFAVVSLLPAVIYYGYGILSNVGHLRLQAKFSIQPHLLLHPYFWKGWLIMIGRVVGFIAFIGAIFGALKFRQGLPRALLIGLWTGYFIFGIVFTQHISTHDYYQLQFIPVVALSLGPIGAMVMNRLANQRWLAAVLGILLVAVVLGIGLNIDQMKWKNIAPDVKSKFKILGAIVGINPQFIKFLNPDFEKEVRIAQEIGKIVSHSTNTIFLVSNHSKHLSYHGELSGFPWPTSRDIRNRKLEGLQKFSVEECFDFEKGYTIFCLAHPPPYLKYSPEYFIVTYLQDFEEQTDLKDFLNRNFPILVQNDDYLIFDLRKRID